MTIQKPYDKNDNDTYVEKLGQSPYQDTLLHMFRNEKGRVVGANGIRGDFTVESDIKARNNVLHFPAAKDLAKNHLVKIKDKDVTTFCPLSMVQRYELDESNLTYRQKTPIFYDKQIDKFVILLDYRFARDISALETEFSLNKELVKIYPAKDQQFSYVGLIFDSINDIDKDNTPAFEHFFSEYKDYKMTLQNGEKVIILRYKTLQDDKINLLRFSHANSDHILGNAIHTQSFHFEHAVAVRFGKRYYLCDQEGKILQKTAFHFDKKNEQAPVSNSQDLRNYRPKLDSDAETYVVPYSEEQHKIISGLASRLQLIHSELANIFRKATNVNESVDHSVMALPDKSIFKTLEHKK